MRIRTTLVLAFLALGLVGCGEYTHESAVEEMLDINEDLVEVLKSVTDVESAKASGDKAQDVLDRLKAAIEKMNKLEEPTEAEEKALDEKYKARFEEIQEAMKREGKRIAELGPDVQRAMMENAPDMSMDDVDMPEWMR